MKSGTTLTQMVVYQLLSDGNMDFKHIYDVSPFLDEMVNEELIENMPSPRILKTHYDYKHMGKKREGKIIYCIRNGMDVALSQYHHFLNYNDPDIKWDSFFEYFMEDRSLASKSFWFTHLKHWIKNENNLDVYYVYYENLTQNMRETLIDISKFLNVEVNEDCLERGN